MKNNTLIFLIAYLSITTCLFSQQTIYVSSTGAGLMDGTSEANAYGNFATALAAIDSAGDVLRIVGDLSPGSHNLSSKGFAYTIEGDSGGSTLTGTDASVRMFTINGSSGTGQDVTFRNIVFTGSTNTTGAGGGIFFTNTDASITFENCVFNGNSNTATAGGGALFIGGSSTLTVTDCTFHNNSSTNALGKGGAISFTSSGSSTITNSTFFNNKITRNNNDFGAAIRIEGSSVTVTNCLFYNNKVNDGTGSTSDIGASAAGTQNFVNSLGELVNTNVDNVTNSTVFKKPSTGTAADLTNSSLTWNASENRVEFTAPNILTDDTPIDFGDDGNDAGAWDSKINMFKGTTDSDWATGTNWTSTATPTSTENVTLLSDSPALVISGSTNAVCNDLSVDASSSLTINSGGTLIVNGTSSGNVTYKRTLGTTNWYLMGSPVAGVTFNDAFVTANNIASGTTDANNRGVATYDTTNDSWTYLQSGGSISSTAGVGYSVKQATAGDVTFTGTINTSDVSVSVVTGGTGGFNLLGVPFTSDLNSASFLSDNTGSLVSETLWVWNQGTSNYETHVTGDSFVLAAGQGFFVRANSATNLTIAESYQTTGGTFQRSADTEVKLLLTDGSSDRFAKIKYVDNATTGFDNGWDGETFGGITNPFDIFTNLVTGNQGQKYQVQSLPKSDMESTIVPIGITADTGEEITFTAEVMNLPAGLKVFLEDRQTNTFTRLDEANTEYTITLDKALNDIGRFYIHTSASALNTPEAHLEHISVYTTNSNNLRIVGIAQGNASVKLYNIVGKEVLSHNFTSNGVSDITLPKVTRGIYIVQVITEEGKLNKKIVLE